MLHVTVYWPFDKQFGKSFQLDDENALTSGETFSPYICKAEELTFEGIVDFGDWLRAHEHKNFIFTYGLPKKKGELLVAPADLMRKEESLDVLARWPEAQNWPIIQRSNKHLTYRRGRMLVPNDYDPGGQQVLSDEEVLARLIEVEPSLAGVAYASYASSSSFIKRSADGKILKGRGGCRHIFDAFYNSGSKDFEKAGPRPLMQIIHKRLALAGYGRWFIKTNGLGEIRTHVDCAVYRASQPDFAGSPILGAGLERARPPVKVVEGQTWGMSAIRPLSPEENRAFATLEAEFREEHADEMASVREAWQEDQAQKAHEASGGKVSLDEARARQRAADRRDGLFLPLSHAVHLDEAQRWVTGFEITASPGQFVGLAISSPSEPYYRMPDTSQPNRHMGKIVRAPGGQIELIDYAHGSFDRYRFDDIRDFEAVLARSEEPSTPAEEVAEEIGPAVVNAAEIYSYGVFEGDYVAEARRLVQQEGVSAVAGAEMERATLEVWIKERRGMMVVQDMEAAARMRRQVLELRPDAKVVILAPRDFDASAYRARHGADVLSYPDGAGGYAGLNDTICDKADTVKKLHKAGFLTVSGKTCVLKQNGRTIFCPFFHSCGYNKRHLAQEVADIYIRTRASLAGQDNPLIEPEGGKPADVLIVDMGNQTSALSVAWKYSDWRRHDVLRDVLDLVRDGDGFPPEVMPRGMEAALEDLAGTPAVTPSMSARISTSRVEAYAIGAKHRMQPLPQEAVNMVHAWFEGRAAITVTADRVTCRRHEPPRRLDGLTTVATASSAMKLPLIMGQLSETDAYALGHTETVSKILRPSSIIQATDMREKKPVSLDKHLALAAKGAKVPQPLRDILAWARTAGPGIVLAPETDHTLDLFSDMDVQLADPRSMDLTKAAALPTEARWGVVLTRNKPGDDQIKERIGDLPLQQWPAIMWDTSQPVTHKTKAAYRLSDGSTVQPAEEYWRWTGADELTDAVFLSLANEPAFRLMEHLGLCEKRDGLKRTLIIAHGFPLCHPMSPRYGVSPDEVVTIADFFPSASWLAKTEGLSNKEASMLLGVGERRLQKERKIIDEAVELQKLKRLQKLFE